MKLGYFLILLIVLGCSDRKELRLQKFLLKGNLSLKEGNPEQAMYYFKEALKVDPCFADALNNLGTISFQQTHWDEALTYYNQAIRCYPEFLPAYFNRANTYYELKEYFNAQKDVQKIIAQKPDTAVVYFIQGLVDTKMRNYSSALIAFDKAIVLDSLNVEYKVNRGTVHYYLHQYPEAESDLATAAALNANEPNIYNTLAMIEIGKGNHEAALVQIQKALTLSPDQPFYLNNRGFIYLMQNRLDEALADIDRSISIDPNNGWAYRNKGIYRLLKGDFSGAERLLNQALAMDGFIDKIHFYLGMAYYKNGRVKEACDHFRKSERMGDRMATAELLRSCR
jgi:tetratricopeptide (TPR) repeat protein